MAQYTTVIALYDDFSDAERAINDLIDSGYSRQNVSLIANDTSGEYSRYVETLEMDQDGNVKQKDDDSSDAGNGAAFGAVIGTLTGLGVAVIPAVGPVLAIGPWAAALVSGVGAAGGAATGGVTAALTELGADEDEASAYAEGVRRGGTLVVVDVTDHHEDHAENILDRHKPVDIDERADLYRGEGWSNFDETSTPYTEAEIEEHRERYKELTSAESDTRRSRRYETERDHDPFEYYDRDFRDHFNQNYTSADYTYAQYIPAYRYGYILATNPRSFNAGWEDIEPEARRRWEEQNPGTWSQVRDAVEHAWERVKQVAPTV